MKTTPQMKAVAATVAAAMLATTLLPSLAEARPGKGYRKAPVAHAYRNRGYRRGGNAAAGAAVAGIAGALIGGALAASQRPRYRYYEPAYGYGYGAPAYGYGGYPAYGAPAYYYDGY